MSDQHDSESLAPAAAEDATAEADGTTAHGGDVTAAGRDGAASEERAPGGDGAAAGDGAAGGDGAAVEDGPAVGDGEGATGGRKRKFWRELVVIVGAAVVIVVLLKVFVVGVYRIPSQSMENTLLPGDRVLVNRLVYHFRGIHRGDIVVFNGTGSWDPPAGPASADPLVRWFDSALSDLGLKSEGTDYIKRVIGLPGDRVACCTNGKVTVNGVPLDEQSYLYPGAAPSTTPFSVTVPPGRLWVLGDDRPWSCDSRCEMSQGAPEFGTVPENKVAGRAFVIIWPFSRFGDLPIPSTFQQAALSRDAAQALGTAASVVAAAPPVGALGVAVAVGVPLLIRRRRRGRR